MQVIAANRAGRRQALVPILVGAVAGTTLVVAGLALAYIAYATPLMDQVVWDPRPSVAQSAVGMAAWSIALIAPAALLLLGTNRLAVMLAAVRRRSQRGGARRAAALPEDVVIALRVDTGDGRIIPEVLLGSFGAVVIRDLPPAVATRHRGQFWEAHTSDGWVRIDNPLDAATRDAERLRRWFAHDDHDFVVRVYAAVVDPDGSTERTPACAVVTQAQLAPWLGSLPAQRSLTQGRRERLLAMVREAV